MTTSCNRRQAVAHLGGLGLAALLAACASEDTTTSDAGPTTSGAAAGSNSTSDSCSTIPRETAGPYPADGSNGPDVLSTEGVIREDLTTSFGDLSGSVDGVPLTITFRLTDVAAGCAPLAGAAVYAWHCDGEGRYSLYSGGVTDQNWLRGVQVSGDDGVVRFRSIFPGCYPGRWPHVHFEVYSSAEDATGGGRPIATSQLALPQDACEAVYADGRYTGSTANLARLSLTSDNVFGDDGGVHQVAAVTGDRGAGYDAALTVPV